MRGGQKRRNNGVSGPTQKTNFSECRIEAKNLGLFFFTVLQEIYVDGQFDNHRVNYLSLK